MLTQLAALVMYFKYDGALVMYKEALQPFTKPPPFQRNGLTCSANPLFECCVEGKAK